MDEATAAVSWGPDRIDLFWVDTAGALIHRASRGGAWDAPPWRSIRSGRLDRVSSTAFACLHAAIFA